MHIEKPDLYTKKTKFIALGVFFFFCLLYGNQVIYVFSKLIKTIHGTRFTLYYNVTLNIQSYDTS